MLGKQGITKSGAIPINMRAAQKSLDQHSRHVSGYVVYKDKMWIVGGDANQGYHMFDVWNSADGRKWNYVNKKKPVPWGPRALHHTLVYRDKIWIMGGQTNPPFAKVEEKFYRDIWNSVDGVRWNEVPQTPWSVRHAVSVFVHDGALWMTGGPTGSGPDVWKLTRTSAARKDK